MLKTQPFTVQVCSQLQVPSPIRQCRISAQFTDGVIRPQDDNSKLCILSSNSKLKQVLSPGYNCKPFPSQSLDV